MQALQPDRLITVSDAAATLRVSRSLIRKLIREGNVVSVKVARCRRIPLSAIERATREGLRVESPGGV